MRYVVSFLVAFVVAFLAGKVLIPLLRRLKAGQGVKEYGPAWHNSKQNTPTMGGLMFIVGITVTVLTLSLIHI